MATGGDADFFAAQWGLDEAARVALLQLDPETQVKVISDFSPKPGTRDVNRLFHGFIKSVRTGPHFKVAQQPVAEALEALPADAAPPGAEEKLSGQSWHVQTDTVDVEAFLNRWGLDEAAQAMMMDQPPEVQARVIGEFAPKPGTRDVNRLLHGFIRSVRTRAAPPPRSANHATVEAIARREQEEAYRHAASQALAAQEEMVVLEEPSYRYDPEDNYLVLEESVADNPQPVPYTHHRMASRGRAAWGSSAPQSSGAPGLPRFQDVPSFISHWGLDAAAQAALQQLAPDMQAKVLSDFAPKAGTRDVNRLFHGFIRSIQTTFPGQASQGGRAPDTRAPPSQQGFSGGRGSHGHSYAASMAQETYTHSRTAGGSPYGAHVSTAAYAAAPAQPAAALDPVTQTARLQAFVDHWGLDAGSVAALVELTPEMQIRVATEFAPRPHTQDINRLFRGFIRSVVGRQPRVYTIVKQEAQPEEGQGTAGTYGVYGEAYGEVAAGAPGAGHAADGFLAEDGAFNDVPPTVLADSPKRASDGNDQPPMREELDNFIRGWGLSEECLITLEGESPSVQRRVLDQFRPKPGTRDVRSLFFGFMRSLASGGGKRPRVL
uniref:Uncharacterized protein n=1 Tax=Alexandrium monilatum TaxID=311494 RepID=A0A7S4WCL7_9DINO